MLMDWDAQGMHFRLMCISWQQDHPGTIPSDEMIIRRWLRNPPDEVWNRVWPQIRPAWKLRDNFLQQIGLIREWKKQKAWIKKSRIGGKHSGITRRTIHEGWLKNGLNQKATCPTPTPTPTKEGEGESPLPPLAAWLAKVNGMAGREREAAKDALVAELTGFHLPFAYQDELIAKFFAKEKSHASDGSESIFKQAARFEAARKAQGLRKAAPAGEILAGVRDLPDVRPQTEPGAGR